MRRVDGSIDGGVRDVGVLGDARPDLDSGNVVVDATPSDSGIGAGAIPTAMNGGCGCHVMHASTDVAGAWLGCATLLLVTLRVRRRVCARRAA